MHLEEVVVEMALGRETLLAARVSTVVGFLTRMQSKMGFQVSFLVKGFAAPFERTDEVFDAVVLFYMDVQSLDARVRLIAALDRTLVLLDGRMDLHVVLEVSTRHEVFATARHFANKRAAIL
jgi:hypothetical protein